MSSRAFIRSTGAARPDILADERTPPVGRPFQKGHDPRRHTGGSSKHPATRALQELTGGDPERLKELWEVAFAQARGGDARWAALILAYLDGKPVAKTEVGEPGAFQRIDLSEYSSEELREFIRAVRKPEGEGADSTR